LKKLEVNILSQLSRFMVIPCILLILLFTWGSSGHAEDKKEDLYDKRMALYKKTEAITQIPWYYIATIDQYERQIQENTDEEERIISVQLPEELWFGPGNSAMIMNEQIINFFNGIGKDGDGDHQANPNNPEDALYSIATYLMKFGPTEEDIKIGLWNLYKRDRKSTRLNSSHVSISYAVFCLKKKTDRYRGCFIRFFSQLIQYGQLLKGFTIKREDVLLKSALNFTLASTHAAKRNFRMIESHLLSVLDLFSTHTIDSQPGLPDILQ